MHLQSCNEAFGEVGVEPKHGIVVYSLFSPSDVQGWSDVGQGANGAVLIVGGDGQGLQRSTGSYGLIKGPCQVVPGKASRCEVRGTQA